VTESQETLVNALKKKMELDHAAADKVDKLKDKLTPPQLAEARGIEQAKVSDALRMEFSIDLETIMDQCKKLNLFGHPEVKGVAMKFAKEAHQAKKMAAFQKHAPPQDKLTEIVAEAESLGNPEYNTDGTITFEWFLKASAIVQKYSSELIKEQLQQKISDRRKALKLNNPKLYQEMMGDANSFKKNTKMHVQIAVFKTLKTPKSVLEKSMKTFFSDAEKRAAYEQNKVSTQSKRIPKELSKDETLAAVKAYHENRTTMSKMACDMVAKGAKPGQVYGVMKMSNIKCADQLYNQTGVDFRDMAFNVQRLGLKEDPTYAQIKSEAKATMTAVLQNIDEASRSKVRQMMKRVAKKKGAKPFDGDAEEDVEVEVNENAETGEDVEPEAEAPDSQSDVGQEEVKSENQ
jgi:hypothetical protein